MIDPGCVLIYHHLRKRIGVHCFKRMLRAVDHSKSSLRTVEQEEPVACAGADNFGDAASGSVRLKLHLPEAMHGCNVSLCEVKIFVIRSKNVGDHQAVELNRYRCFQSGNVEVGEYFLVATFFVLPEAFKRIQEFTEGRQSFFLRP